MIPNHYQFDRRIFWMLLVFEATLFYSFYVREIKWHSPEYFDQDLYLTQAYRLEEQVLWNGPRALWDDLCSDQHLSGVALPIEGAILGLVFGGTRLPELGVLFVSFCALQAVAFGMSAVVWGHRAFRYAILGLILSQTTLWFIAGGMFDFRIDFLAYCVYGIWACAVLRSKLFLNRSWSLGCGLLASFLVLNRFLAVIYIVGVSAGFAVACVIIWLRERSNVELVRRMKQRLLNLSLSVGILAAIAGPVLFHNRKAIYGKYVVAQFFHEKGIRAREFGIVGLSGHLLYYPVSIIRDHLGPTFLWASAVCIICGLGTRIFAKVKGPPAANATPSDETFFLQVIFLLGAILGPITVLTIDVSKSPIIGGIVGVPAALLVGTITVGLSNNCREYHSRPGRNVFVAGSVLVFCLGIFNQFNHASRHLPEYAERHDLERLEELNKWLITYANENGWRNPTISFDVIINSLNAGTITTSGFEQTHRLIEFRPLLGGDIMGVDRKEAISLLANSDYVVLTDIPKTGVYPFYERLRQYENDLKGWASDHLVLARTIHLDTFTANVYVRPTATASAPGGDWITRSGLSIVALRASLQKFPEIRLSGMANFSWLPKIPAVSATIETDGDFRTAPAFFRRVDDHYEILIDTSSIKLPSSDRVRLDLSFDTFFVPKTMGISDDTRELVVQAPNLVQLIPTSPRASP
jgi:hypothetical protein